LRFTVHRPANAEVSPCCHRPSGGDVACGVHVSITRTRAAGDALENRLALAVFRRDMPTPGASLRRVRSGDEVEPPGGFVLQPGNQRAPPLAVNLSVEATLLRDVGAGAFTRAARRPGHATHIQLLGTDGREAPRHIGGGFSTQSRRRSVSRARNLAMASFVRTRRCDPRRARASRCCNRRSRFVSPARRPGAWRSSPVDSAADTVTPRSIPTTLPSSGPGIDSGMAAKAMCQRPDRSKVTR
jgi:hypothetical protein